MNAEAPVEGAAKLRANVLAGVTVALVGLPQCLAYAMMSGLPPAYGLVTAAVPGLVAAIFGKSPQVVTGPTNTTGLLILAALSPYLGANGLLAESGLPLLAALTLMTGAMRMFAALIGGEKLLRYLPESVLAGFSAGAGVLICAMQFDEALGLPAARAGNLPQEMAAIVEHFRAGHWPQLPAVVVTGLTACALFCGRKFLPRWPIALLVVLAAAALAYFADLDIRSGLALVQDRAAVPNGWPQTKLPTVDPEVLRSLVLPAAAITLLGTLELAVCVRFDGGKANMRRELAAQGLANIAGAFAGAFPASASLTRSALLKLTGASKRLAAGVAAVAVVPLLFFGAHLVAHIPQASLAGVLLVSALGMVNIERLKRMMKTSRQTLLLLVLTFVATLVLELQYAILLGAAVGLLMHEARTSMPRISVLKLLGERLVAMAPDDAPDTVIVEVSGNLHYAAVEPFRQRVEQLLPQSVKFIIIDLSHAHDLRYAALQAFEEMAADFKLRGANLRLAGVPDEFVQMLLNAKSALDVTPAETEPGLSVRKAINPTM